MRKWRENEEMERDSLSLFSNSVSNSLPGNFASCEGLGTNAHSITHFLNLKWYHRAVEQQKKNLPHGLSSSQRVYNSWIMIYFKFMGIYGNILLFDYVWRQDLALKEYYIWTLSMPALNCGSLILNVNANSRKHSICLLLIIRLPAIYDNHPTQPNLIPSTKPL